MILLLDNYDSFVHNLARYFRRLGCETKVVRSDQVDAATCLSWNPDAVVFSPGPKGPLDTGCCIDLLQEISRDCPILGVCLGHQTIAAAFGATVARCGPMHGMSSAISHKGSGLFAGLPSPMMVGRYHSLAVRYQGLPDCLEVTAVAEDGTIMGLRHRDRPLFGVQFHPESVLTEHGAKILQNFVSFFAARDSSSSAKDASEPIVAANDEMISRKAYS